jgi:hypothetical protein
MKFKEALIEKIVYDKKTENYYDDEDQSVIDYKKTLKNPKKSFTVWKRNIRVKI